MVQYCSVTNSELQECYILHAILPVGLLSISIKLVDLQCLDIPTVNIYHNPEISGIFVTQVSHKQ